MPKVVAKRKIEVVEHDNHISVIVPDPMSGRVGRYTVHSISLVGEKFATVVGRELPIRLARKIATL